VVCTCTFRARGAEERREPLTGVDREVFLIDFVFLIGDLRFFISAFSSFSTFLLFFSMVLHSAVSSVGCNSFGYYCSIDVIVTRCSACMTSCLTALNPRVAPRNFLRSSCRYLYPSLSTVITGSNSSVRANT